MNKNKHTILLFMLGGLALIVGLVLLLPLIANNTNEQQQDTRPIISTSIYPLYFLAREIADENTQIVNLTPPGAEPHDYELTPGDIRTITESALLLMNGGELEHWGEDLAKIVDPAQTEVLTMANALPVRTIGHNDSQVIDPHFWLSPVLMRQMTDIVLEAIIRTDPTRADIYRARAAALSAKLESLDREFRTTLSSCSSKELVTAHDAFGYLAAEYGLITIPVSGLSPENEPSPRQMAEVAEIVRERKVKVIFFETLVSPRLAETLARETGARTLMLDPLEGIDPEEAKGGANYLTVMQKNLKELSEGLSCHTQAI